MNIEHTGAIRRDDGRGTQLFVGFRWLADRFGSYRPALRIVLGLGNSSEPNDTRVECLQTIIKLKNIG